MFHVLLVPLPWYLVGPMMGLSVVGLYALANLHLGVTGAYVQLVDYARRRPIQHWRLWFLGGVILGSLLVAIAGSSPQFGLGYGALGHLLPFWLLVPVLFFGGLLIGFGARWAGACTSGHAVSGCATRSPGSYVAAMTFFITAVVVTLALHGVTGGRL